MLISPNVTIWVASVNPQKLEAVKREFAYNEVPSHIDNPVNEEIWSCAYQRIVDSRSSLQQNEIRKNDLIVAMENGLEIIPTIKGGKAAIDRAVVVIYHCSTEDYQLGQSKGILVDNNYTTLVDYSQKYTNQECLDNYAHHTNADLEYSRIKILQDALAMTAESKSFISE